MNEAMNVLQTIGNTPLVELTRYAPRKSVHIFAKLEGSNPGGSIKDRVAKYLIEDAERRGLLEKRKVIIEATSGNTGIGLAMVSAIKGYRFIAVMSASASIERRKLLEQYGAEIILTDKDRGTNFALKTAAQMVADNPDRYVMLNQFENPINVRAHYETTGAEIVRSLPEITHFVAGLGTGGTIMGIGKRLREFDSQVKVIGVEPNEHSRIQGLRNMTEYTPPILDLGILNELLKITDDESAFGLAREVYRKEGISVGISSGAALWGAIEVAKNLKKGNVVTIFPDRGDRYVSTELFR